MNLNRIFNKKYIMLTAVNTLMFISFYMTNPVLPEYAIAKGLNVVQAGIISGILSLTALIIRPVSGWVTDRIKHKTLYVAVNICIVLAYISYTGCNTFPVFLIVRIFHGICFAVNSTLILVMVTFCIPEERMGEGIGFFGIGSIIAIAFAPGLGLKINHIYGGEISFALAAGVSVLSILMVVFFWQADENLRSLKMEEDIVNIPSADKMNLVQKLIAKEVLLFALIAGVFSFINSIEYTFISLYSQSKGISDISVYFIISAVTVFFTRLFAGNRYDRKGLNAVIYPAFAAGMIGMAVLGKASSLAMFLTAAVFKAFAQGAGQPALQSQSLVSVDRNRRGVAGSTYYLGSDIMQGIGPIAGSLIIDSCGYEAIYYFCGLLIFLSMIIYTICSRGTRKKEKE